MIPALKAEFRKLSTVRSTYGIILFCLAVTVFFSFYISGYRQTHPINDPTAYSAIMTGVARFLAFFISFAAALLVTHEYRYNTITYTLTAPRRRIYVLLAKFIVVTVFSVGLTLLMCAIAPLLLSLGMHLKGLSIAPQTLHIGDVVWRTAFFGWFYTMFAFIVAAIVRNQVGTYTVLFLYPGLGEALLTLLLKGNTKYLPFQALASILQDGSTHLAPSDKVLSSSNAAVLLIGYLVFGLLVAWLLFQRRDAN